MEIVPRWRPPPGSRRGSLVEPLTAERARRLAAKSQPNQIPPGRILAYRRHVPYYGFLLASGVVGLEQGHGTRRARARPVEAPALIGVWYAVRRLPLPVTIRSLTAADVRAVRPRPVRDERDGRQRRGRSEAPRARRGWTA